MKYLFICLIILAFASCSSSSSGDTEPEVPVEEVLSLKGKSFVNVSKDLNYTNIDENYNEAQELISLINSNSRIKNHVKSIEVDSSDAKVSKFYYTVDKYVLEFIDNKNCKLTETLDYVSTLYNAIKYKTYIQFDMNYYSLSTPSYTESISATKLVIGNKIYELYGYGYYNTAYKIDETTSSESVTNERTVVTNYRYEINDKNVYFYDSDGTLCLTAAIGESSITMSDGMIFKSE